MSRRTPMVLQDAQRLAPCVALLRSRGKVGAGEVVSAAFNEPGMVETAYGAHSIAVGVALKKSTKAGLVTVMLVAPFARFR